MKKSIIVIIIIIFSIYGCEKDDFCTENPVTPNLVLRFYNKDTIANTKQVNRLSIIATNKTDSLFTSQTTDSIAIPLNSLTRETSYVLKMNSSDGSTATNQFAKLIISYTPKEEFISRSCGYRVIFNSLKLTSSGWIENISTSEIETINNQSEAHVKVYH